MTTDAIFRYASLTKAIVSVAALRLAEMGTIDLRAPVTRYLPEFQPALPSGEQPEITITHLLTHTAGLSYGFLQGEDSPYRRAGISDGLDAVPISNDENLRRLETVNAFCRALTVRTHCTPLSQTDFDLHSVVQCNNTTNDEGTGKIKRPKA